MKPKSETINADDAARFGKYLLVDRLGRGGMAEVWKAKISGPAGFSRTMVLKRILPHLVEDEQFKTMFIAEARLSARLNHANIVQVFELGDVGGELYLAMEYVRGRDLVSVVRALLLRGAPPPGLGAFVVRDVCRALAYAHDLTDEEGRALRLIHRDVSPSNVMIGFDGAVKLLDFGIAKALAEANDNRTTTGTLKGKFGYMSPEQVEGKDVDHRSDLFAAGVVLHEALTGKRLFKGSSDMQTIAMVREAKVDPPSSLNPEVPPELDTICLKALEKDPKARWRGCDEFALALDDVVHQLKYGPERLQSLLKELFPDEPSRSAIVEVEPHSPMRARRRSRWRRRAVRAAMAGVVICAGAAAWLTLRQHFLRREATAPETRVVVREVTPPAPTTVNVRVASTPAGADVFIDGDADARGRTPASLTLARGETPARVTVRLGGYEPQTTEVVPDSNAQLKLTLIKVAPPAPPISRALKKARPKHAATPRTQPQAAPDLHRGDVVDPFAK